MYKIEQENNEFVVYCEGKVVEKFSTEKEAIQYVTRKTQYDTIQSDLEEFIIE